MKADPILNKQIGQRVKMIRKMKGMTQEQLADIINISVKHLSSVECGKARFSYENLISACNALDTSTDFLILGKTPLGDDLPIPEDIIETLRSNDITAKKALLEYLNMYVTLHKRK
ncbi:MAG: helix-turn-helix transcriptional regulator [Lachnospiraceae bacterium]|nr:helix-turn-helix transcriptional regulator [Lachnospiraceae bacterium]